MRLQPLAIIGLFLFIWMWNQSTVCLDTIDAGEAAPPTSTDPCEMQCTAPSLQAPKEYKDTGASVREAFKLMSAGLEFIAIVIVGEADQDLVFALGIIGSGIVDGFDIGESSKRDSASNFWIVNQLEKYISDNTEYELCRIKQLLGNYLNPLSQYIQAEAMTTFNEQLLGGIQMWNDTKFKRLCANLSNLSGDNRPKACWRDPNYGPQNSTECNSTNAQMADIQKGAILCRLPLLTKARSVCESLLPRGVCGTDRRCYNVVGIIDVGLDACEVLEYLKTKTSYGNALNRYYQLDALALYSRYALFELAIYNAQILSGVGGASVLWVMQSRALAHQGWILQRVDALRTFAAKQGRDVIIRSSRMAVPESDEWKFTDSGMVSWPTYWKQCGLATSKIGATPLKERRYMHSVNIGCTGKNPLYDIEGEEKYRLIGVNADADDLEWCKGYRNCSVENLVENCTSRTCRVTSFVGIALPITGYPPRAIGSYTNTLTPQTNDLANCAFRMPVGGQDSLGDLCASTFSWTDCFNRMAKCNVTLQQIWNTTVDSAHVHLQWLMSNMTIEYAEIAVLLYVIATNRSVFNGTDPLTGRAQLERIWPRPLGIDINTVLIQ
jgi:hypothetical protein